MNEEGYQNHRRREQMRLIDADAAIERFQGLTELAVGEGAALVKALIFAGLKSRSITPTVNGWISVKDKLPEEDSHVLVWEKQGFAFVDWYKFGVWQLGTENGAIITHWMPLPDPPEEVTGDG